MCVCVCVFVCLCVLCACVSECMCVHVWLCGCVVVGVGESAALHPSKPEVNNKSDKAANMSRQNVPKEHYGLFSSEVLLLASFV